MPRELLIRRHTDNDGDTLSPDGISNAIKIGENTDETIDLVVSTGAQRATQTAACIIGGGGLQVRHGVHVIEALRSNREDEWKDAYSEAGGGHLEDDFQRVAPDLVDEDSEVLAGGLREALTRLGEDERALIVGHSPTNEAAVYGLTGQVIEPQGKGEGVRLTQTDDGWDVTPLD